MSETAKSVFSDTAISEMFHSHLRKSQRRSPGDALWKSSKKFSDIPGKHQWQMTKAGSFTIKRLHHTCFSKSFTNLSRATVELLLRNLWLTSRSGENEENTSEE